MLDSPSDGKGEKINLGSIVSSPLSPPHPTHRFPHSMPERKGGENKRIRGKKKEKRSGSGLSVKQEPSLLYKLNR